MRLMILSRLVKSSGLFRKNYSALMFAADGGHDAVIDLLLRNAAQVDLKNNVRVQSDHSNDNSIQGGS